MTPIVKICGLSEPRTLDAALEARADMVGFVFFEPSPRHVTLAAAQMLAAQVLAARVDGRAQKVALTVDADDATLAAVIEALTPDLLQLHGSETPERVRAIRSRFGLPVMKAIPIAGHDDLLGVAAFDAVCDHLLFDARAPVGASRPGGNGGAFDWAILNGLETRCPWLLAGGLNPANIGAALRTSGARGVDVSSGVEIAPGIKDTEKIARFVAAARADRPG